MQGRYLEMGYLTSKLAYPDTQHWHHQLIVSNALGDSQHSWDISFVFVFGFVFLIFGRHYEVNHFYLHNGVDIIYVHYVSNPQCMACNHYAVY